MRRLYIILVGLFLFAGLAVERFLLYRKYILP